MATNLEAFPPDPRAAPAQPGEDRLRLFYYGVTTNFGDHMNAWLWPRLLPSLIGGSADEVLVGIGSLIKADLGKVPGRKVIFGTGSGYGPMPYPEEVTDWRIYCVRGPLTARLLNLDPEKAVVDGAWLVDELPDMRYQPGSRSGTVFVPHWTTDIYANWRQPCQAAGIGYVSPLLPGVEVFERIANARLAIVESLHGAIMADYYRVPWIPVASDGRVLSFKWLDFCMSLSLRYRPIRLPQTDMVERLFAGPARPWAGAVEYLPEAHESQFKAVGFAAQAAPTAAYRLKVRAKAAARPLRNAGLAGVQALRASPMLRAANQRRSDQLATLLTRIAQEPASLSDDAIRAEKLDRLRAALGTMRAHYGAA